MKKEIQVLKQTELLGHQFTVYGTPEEPLFRAKDVADFIEHTNVSKMVQSLDEDEKVKCFGIIKDITNGYSECESSDYNGSISLFLTEYGLYEVLMQSRKPIAKQFKKGVKAILKEIRTKGGYMVAREDESPEEIMSRALIIAQETIERRNKQISELNEVVFEKDQQLCDKDQQLCEKDQQLCEKDQQIKEKQQEIIEKTPGYNFSKAVETSGNSILIGEMARILAQNGVKIGQKRLFEFLRSNGYLFKSGSQYNQPTQRAVEMGLFEIKKTVITAADGSQIIKNTTKVTPKGQIYFVNKFINNNNIFTQIKKEA